MGSDITYLKVIEGNFLYLAVFLDFYSRKIVGWDLSHSLSSEVVLRAFYGALKTRTVREGLIVHSGQRSTIYSGRVQEKAEGVGFCSVSVSERELL